MKKTVIAIAAAFLALAFTACQKGGPAAKAWVVRQPGNLYSTEKEADATYMSKWLKAVDIGTEVKLLDEKPMAYEYSEKDEGPTNFYKVEVDGQKGFLPASNIAIGSALAVISQDGVAMYTDPRDSAVMNSKLAALNLVVVQEASGDFSRVSYFDKDSQTYVPYGSAQRWLATSSIDSNDGDVAAACLLRKYQATDLKLGNKKLQLLNIIATKYSGSAFAAQAAQEASKIAAVKKGGATVLSDPSSSSAPVDKGQLAEGDGVVIAELGQNDTVDGKDGAWYRISAPVAGWVFGAGLDLAQ